jgi:hypothetical protein
MYVTSRHERHEDSTGLWLTFLIPCVALTSVRQSPSRCALCLISPVPPTSYQQREEHMRMPIRREGLEVGEWLSSAVSLCFVPEFYFSTLNKQLPGFIVQDCVPFLV